MKKILILFLILSFLTPVFAVDSLKKTTSYPYGKIKSIGGNFDTPFLYDENGKLFSVGGKRVWYHNDGKIKSIGGNFDTPFLYDENGKLFSVGGKRVWYHFNKVD